MATAKDTNENQTLSQRQSQNQNQNQPGPVRSLQKLSSLKFPRNTEAPSSSGSGAKNRKSKDILRYTSLRDLKDSTGNVYFDRNGSDISIKNRLVKHAASVYLQSSAILIGAGRDPSCFASFRGRVGRNRAVFCSCWRAYFRDPIMACFRPILRFFSLVAW